jgi:hypothetical protein
MKREQMLYHANEKGSLNFDVRSMKGETQQELDFLLLGGFLESDTNSLFSGSRETMWQDYKITHDGKVLLAILRLEYTFNLDKNSEKHQGRIEQLREVLKKYGKSPTQYDAFLTKNQKRAVKHMEDNKTTKFLQQIKEQEEVGQEVLSPYKVARTLDGKPEDRLDVIDLEELSLASMFNMSVGLGPKGFDATRTDDYVLKKAVEELGELALEINIYQGTSYKQPGKDGIKGEAVDLAICALDMFALQCHNMTSEEIEREFLSYMLTKLNKWRDTLR